jgi:hypothetical protein
MLSIWGTCLPVLGPGPYDIPAGAGLASYQWVLMQIALACSTCALVPGVGGRSGDLVTCLWLCCPLFGFLAWLQLGPPCSQPRG